MCRFKAPDWHWPCYLITRVFIEPTHWPICVTAVKQDSDHGAVSFNAWEKMTPAWHPGLPGLTFPSGTEDTAVHPSISGACQQHKLGSSQEAAPLVYFRVLPFSDHTAGNVLHISYVNWNDDFKCFPQLQVTVHYKQENGAVIPLRVHTVVISVQHDDNISLEEQKRILKEKVIKAVVPAKYLDDKTFYHLQPSGRFVIGGPQVSAFYGSNGCMKHCCIIHFKGLSHLKTENQLHFHRYVVLNLYAVFFSTEWTSMRWRAVS